MERWSGGKRHPKKARLSWILVVVLEIFNICPLNPRNKFVRSKIGLILKC